MGADTINILEIIYTLKSKWRNIVIVVLIITIIVSLYSFFLISPLYSSNLKVFIGKNSVSDDGYNYEDMTIYQHLAKTYSELIPTEDIIKKAISHTNLDIDSKDIIKGLEVTNDENSQIISLTYKHKEIEYSKIVLDAITEEFIRESRDLSPNASIKIIESSKYPIYPCNLDSIRNIIVGLVTGLFFGITIVLMMEYTSGTFKNKEQIEDAIGLPVIGVIPCNEDQ